MDPVSFWLILIMGMVVANDISGGANISTMITEVAS